MRGYERLRGVTKGYRARGNINEGWVTLDEVKYQLLYSKRHKGVLRVTWGHEGPRGVTGGNID